MSRILVSAVVVLAAAAAAPSVAQGAILYQDGRASHRILLQDESGETNLVSVEGARSVVIHDANAPITVDGVPGCMPVDAWTVSCSASARRRIELDLGAGPDVASIATPRPVQIEGGNGPDRYVSRAQDWPSRVDFDGGIGLDVANYFFATAGVEVSLDLEAGDGRPGDDDQVRRDVETVLGSQFADALAGSPYTTRLAGNDGDDQITGGSGQELLSGGDGQDRIDARDGTPDTVDCGGQLLDWAAVDLGGEASVTGCAQVVS
jgi:Ca2+-binding RTX toxin-like protein